MKERYYSESLLRSLAYEDDTNGNCDGKIDFTVIDYLSGADVAPVRHGKWIPIVNYFHGKSDGRYYCSECRRVVNKYNHYCPDCGAKMDGGSK